MILGGSKCLGFGFVVLPAVLVANSLSTGFAQTAPAAAAASDGAKPSRVKLSMQRLKEMKAKWSANRPKLKACRKQVKAKGLLGDERWFYIEDCMSKG
ncbi:MULTISPECIES: hypothetical protein [unclassified Bradyrhizobium]|uniref:hypothetical protein n=1 Tax=unclassified Bradyrhizobium TaxID=2631580 RepID=UPI0039647CEA